MNFLKNFELSNKIIFLLNLIHNLRIKNLIYNYKMLFNNVTYLKIIKIKSICIK